MRSVDSDFELNQDFKGTRSLEPASLRLTT